MSFAYKLPTNDTMYSSCAVSSMRCGRTIGYLCEVLSAKLKVLINARWLVDHCRWLKRKQEVIKTTCATTSITLSRMAAAAE
jgi:hypothetical protein